MSSIFAAPVKFDKVSGFGGWYRCDHFVAKGDGDVVFVNEYTTPCNVVARVWSYFTNLSWYFGKMPQGQRYVMRLHHDDRPLRDAHLRRVPNFPTIAWQGNGLRGSGEGPFIFFTASHAPNCVSIATGWEGGLTPVGCASCITRDLARLRRLALLMWRRAPK